MKVKHEVDYHGQPHDYEVGEMIMFAAHPPWWKRLLMWVFRRKYDRGYAVVTSVEKDGVVEYEWRDGRGR